MSSRLRTRGLSMRWKGMDSSVRLSGVINSSSVLMCIITTVYHGVCHLTPAKAMVVLLGLLGLSWYPHYVDGIEWIYNAGLNLYCSGWVDSQMQGTLIGLLFSIRNM